MKILLLSDTHGKHSQIEDLPQADILIHSGDLSGRGREHEINDFMDWFISLDYQYKVFIAGNHDFYYEGVTQDRIQKMLPDNTFYLRDSGITIEGIRIWGSPVTPTFFNWAFNKDRGDKINEHWKMIPQDTDILITHGPPYGILDRTSAGLNVGCEALLSVVKTIKPKYHLFGHIHEAYGIYDTPNTTYINGSILNEDYIRSNQPVLFDI